MTDGGWTGDFVNNDIITEENNKKLLDALNPKDDFDEQILEEIYKNIGKYIASKNIKKPSPSSKILNQFVTANTKYIEALETLNQRDDLICWLESEMQPHHKEYFLHLSKSFDFQEYDDPWITKLIKDIYDRTKLLEEIVTMLRNKKEVGNSVNTNKRELVHRTTLIYQYNSKDYKPSKVGNPFPLSSKLTTFIQQCFDISGEKNIELNCIKGVLEDFNKI